MKVLLGKVSILVKFMMIAVFLIGWAKAPEKPPELGLCPIKESQAYRQFLNRPVCEGSKAIYLIDRFKNLPFDIIYDGRTYQVKAVAGFVGAFLRFNYKKDWPAKQWVLKYANRSLGQNELILLRLPDGSTYPAGNILLQELENLEKVIAQESTKPQPVTLVKDLRVRIEGNAMAPEALALVPSK